MTDNKSKTVKYGTTVYAALVFLFVIVAYFIYAYFTAQPVDIGDYVLEINPGPENSPDYLPNVEPPTSPPPGN